MKEIKITNGVAVLKDFCSRGDKKKINACLFEGVSLKAGVGGQATGEGLNFANLEKSNDLALTLIVEKLVINGAEKTQLTTADFDELSTADVNLIISEVNKLVNPELPNA